MFIDLGFSHRKEKIKQEAREHWDLLLQDHESVQGLWFPQREEEVGLYSGTVHPKHSAFQGCLHLPWLSSPSPKCSLYFLIKAGFMQFLRNKHPFGTESTPQGNSETGLAQGCTHQHLRVNRQLQVTGFCHVGLVPGLTRHEAAQRQFGHCPGAAPC